MLNISQKNLRKKADSNTNFIIQAEKLVSLKYDSLNKQAGNGFKESSLDSNKKCQYIKKLKKNSAAGCNGITFEHLKYGMRSKLPILLSVLLSLCIKSGLVPDNFNNILVPVPVLLATAMANSVGSYCVANGSPVFQTSLDAEGAFDFLPHCVIMQKCIGVLPENLWFQLFNCYKNMCTRVRWDSTMSKNIRIQRGMKQGGLWSPFIFILFN